jgi:hypothetical protein
VDDVNAATNDDVYISQVHLNLGPKATMYVPRPYALELNMCQRYYQIHLDPHMNGVTAGNNSSINRLGMVLPTTMRTTPTVGFGPIPLYDGSTVTTLSSVSVNYHQPGFVEIDGTAAGNFGAASRPITGYNGSSGTGFSADAEL